MKLDSNWVGFFIDDTLDVGKQPLPTSEEDREISDKLDEMLKSGEFNKD